MAGARGSRWAEHHLTLLQEMNGVRDHPVYNADCFLHMVEPGENVVVLRKLYGLTHHLRPFAVSPIDDELKEVCS